jgi:NitT/TauT family transport system ATP-binding protein
MTISVVNVSKSYAHLSVLNEICFHITDGELVSIVGPSGCGKSTLLNLVFGLDTPDRGTVEIDGAPRISYMMQDSLLLPWRTLEENASLGAELNNGRTDENRVLVEKYFNAFDLAGALKVYPNASSGGMKQRVALIRTLITKPRLLLLDEPFASLDFDVKLKIQRYLIDYHEMQKATTLIVTHDIDDAIALSQRVIVLADKPSSVKAAISIDFGIEKRDPINARKSPRFSEYFSRVWNEIKYLDEEDRPTAIH